MFVMMRPKLCCHLLRQRTLIKRFFFESDCKCFDSGAAFLSHRRHDAGRIQAATQECSEWDIASHSDPHRIREILSEFFIDLGRVPSHFVFGNRWYFPVHFIPYSSVLCYQEMPWQ